MKQTPKNTTEPTSVDANKPELNKAQSTNRDDVKKVDVEAKADLQVNISDSKPKIKEPVPEPLATETDEQPTTNTRPKIKDNTQNDKEVVIEKRNGAVAWLAFFLALIALSGGGFVTWQGWLFQQSIVKNQTQAAEFKQGLQLQQQQFQQKVTEQLQQTQAYFVQEAKQNQQTLKDLMGAIERKTIDIDAEAARADVNQLINLAARKLGLDADLPATIQILNVAQQRISTLSTPEWLQLKQAIAHDLGALKAINILPTERTYLDLTSVAVLLAKLPLNQASIPDEVGKPVDLTLSNSTDDWLDNIHKTWLTLTDKFITVKRRNGNVEALLSPQQEANLRQNMQAKIMHAQQALMNKQPVLYRDALQQAINWLTQYYIKDDQLMIDANAELERLMLLPIVQDVTQVELTSLVQVQKLHKAASENLAVGSAL